VITARKRLYVDSSAYVDVLLGQAPDALAEALRGQCLLSSVLLVLETTRAILRFSREGGLSPEEARQCLARMDADLQWFQLRALTLDLCTGLRVPVLTTPRTLDLAHLRTALWFHSHEAIDGFVSRDKRQVQAAHELELPVWSG
jgi:hypothetical protein